MQNEGSMRFNCPMCGKAIRAPNKASGTLCRCPHASCRTLIKVPANQDVTMPPPLPRQKMSTQMRLFLCALMVIPVVGVSTIATMELNRRSSPPSISTRLQAARDVPQTAVVITTPTITSKPTDDAIGISKNEAHVLETVPSVSDMLPEVESSTLERPEAVSFEFSHNEPDDPLSDIDDALLACASQPYYWNRRLTRPVEPTKHLPLIEQAALGNSTRRAKLARLLFAHYFLQTSMATDSKHGPDTFRRLPEEFMAASLRLGFSGMITGRLPDGEEFKEGAGRGFFEWAARWQASKTESNYARIATRQTEFNLVALVDSAYSRAWSPDEELPADWLSAQPSLSDTIGFVDAAHEKRRFAGKFARITCKAKHALHDILILANLRTSGPSLAPQSDEIILNALAALEGGRANVNDNFFAVRNYLETMPKAHMVFVRTLRSGDTLDIPMDNASWSVLRNGTIAIYCKEGHFATQQIVYSAPDFKDSDVYRDYLRSERLQQMKPHEMIREAWSNPDKRYSITHNRGGLEELREKLYEGEDPGIDWRPLR